MTEDCNNYKGKPFKGTLPLDTDNNEVLYEKLEKTASYNRQVVYWRRSYLLSFVIVLSIFWLMYMRWPYERELVIGMFITFTVIYFSFNFYQFHLDSIAEERTKQITSILKKRC